MIRGRNRRRPQGSAVVLAIAFLALFLPMLALVRWRYNAGREYTPTLRIRRERRGTLRDKSGTAPNETVVTESHQGSVGDKAVVGDVITVTDESLAKPDLIHDQKGDLHETQEKEAASHTALSLDGLHLASRNDAHCDLLSEAVLGDRYKSDLFNCRVAAAQDSAERACDELAADPPDPPFARANLNIGSYAKGVPGLNISSPSMSLYQDQLSIAVEPLSRSDFVSSGVIATGQWEGADVKTVLDALQRVSTGTPAHSNAAEVVPQEDRAVLLDIGANIGIFSLVAAVLGYTVYSFEAMPRNIDALHQTLCWNPALRSTLTVFPYGLAETEQACHVVSDTINVADGHLLCNNEQLQAHSTGMTSRGTVNTVRMDSFLSGAHVDVVKIDVEGYEPHVLAGAGDSLKAVQYVMSEISAIDLPKKNNATFEEVGLQYLSDWEARGFEIHICEAGQTCFETPATPASEAVGKIQSMGIANALMVPAT